MNLPFKLWCCKPGIGIKPTQVNWRIFLSGKQIELKASDMLGSGCRLFNHRGGLSAKRKYGNVKKEYYKRNVKI